MVKILWWLVSLQGSTSTLSRLEKHLKSVDEQYGEKMNQMKTERKGKALYTEIKNTPLPSEWNISTGTNDKVYWCVENKSQTAEKYHFCIKEFNDPENRKVRSYCQYTGLYRGVAYNNWNLKCHILDHTPIAFHNPNGYGAHLPIMKLGKNFNKSYIGVIAKTNEKYISFNVKTNVKLAGVANINGKEVRKHIQQRFIDSHSFLTSSLNKLSSNFDDNQCKNLTEFYTRDEGFWFMRCKCLYSWDYLDRCKKLGRQSYHRKTYFQASLTLKVSVIKTMSLYSRFWVP